MWTLNQCWACVVCLQRVGKSGCSEPSRKEARRGDSTPPQRDATKTVMQPGRRSPVAFRDQTAAIDASEAAG